MNSAILRPSFSPIASAIAGVATNKDEYVPKYDRNGYEIVRDAFSSNVVFKEKVLCPVCSSNNIIIQKGDGFNIIGNDEIALICNNCKKVYGFNDVKYKDNCPREL